MRRLAAMAKHDELLALFDLADAKDYDVPRSRNLEERSTFSVGAYDFELPRSLGAA